MTSVALLSLCLAANAKPGLLVIDPDVKGASPIEAAVVANGIAAGARDLDAFDVMTSSDLRTMIGVERQRQLLGTETDQTNFAQAMGARHVISSQVTKVGGTLEVHLRLLDTESSKVLAEKTAKMEKANQASTEVQGLTQELLGVLLQGQQGSLFVRASEEGSEVRVDGKLVASTPMAAPLAVSRGTHRLEVGKNSFITQYRPTKVEHNETTVEDVRLVPSPDYIGEYQKKNRSMRIGAWVTLGSAAALLVGAVLVDRLGTEAVYQRDFLPRAQALTGAARTGTDEASGKTYADCAANTSACHTVATNAKGTVEALQGLTVGLAVGAVITAGLSAYFWIAGEDPNKYTKVSFGVLPGGGGAFALTGAF